MTTNVDLAAETRRALRVVDLYITRFVHPFIYGDTVTAARAVALSAPNIEAAIRGNVNSIQAMRDAAEADLRAGRLGSARDRAVLALRAAIAMDTQLTTLAPQAVLVDLQSAGAPMRGALEDLLQLLLDAARPPDPPMPWWKKALIGGAVIGAVWFSAKHFERRRLDRLRLR